MYNIIHNSEAVYTFGLIIIIMLLIHDSNTLITFTYIIVGGRKKFLTTVEIRASRTFATLLYWGTVE